MVHPSLQELLAGHPDFDEVVAEPMWPGPWWRQAWHLSRLWRSWHVDVVLISNPKKAYHLAAWLSGIQCRVGHDRKWGRLLTHRFPDRRVLGERHEVEYNLELLKALGITISSAPALHLPISQEADMQIVHLLESLGATNADRLVAIHPWTSNPKKQWPIERFQALIARLAQEPGVRPIVIGGGEEQMHVADVMQDQHERVVNLVGRLSLTELAALLRTVRLLVSNDSGPMHLAAVVGTPVVALFGMEDRGSHPQRWGPWGDGHTVIHKPFTDLSVEDVLQAVRAYVR